MLDRREDRTDIRDLILNVPTMHSAARDKYEALRQGRFYNQARDEWRDYFDERDPDKDSSNLTFETQFAGVVAAQAVGLSEARETYKTKLRPLLIDPETGAWHADTLKDPVRKEVRLSDEEVLWGILTAAEFDRQYAEDALRAFKPRLWRHGPGVDGHCLLTLAQLKLGTEDPQRIWEKHDAYKQGRYTNYDKETDLWGIDYGDTMGRGTNDIRLQLLGVLVELQRDPTEARRVLQKLVTHGYWDERRGEWLYGPPGGPPSDIDHPGIAQLIGVWIDAEFERLEREQRADDTESIPGLLDIN